MNNEIVANIAGAMVMLAFIYMLFCATVVSIYLAVMEKGALCCIFAPISILAAYGLACAVLTEVGRATCSVRIQTVAEGMLYLSPMLAILTMYGFGHIVAWMAEKTKR